MTIVELGDCVVDASVGVKLFLDDPLSSAAHALFHRLVDAPVAKLYVPDLFYVEVANVLWKYVRWQGMAAESAREYVEDLTEMALTSVPTAELVVDAIQLASTHATSAYDASYIALANHVDCPLVTCDKKLASALNQPERIIILGS